MKKLRESHLRQASGANKRLRKMKKIMSRKKSDRIPPGLAMFYHDCSLKRKFDVRTS